MLKKSKQAKLFDNLLKITEQCFRGKGYVPLSETELIQRLCLPEQHEPIFREVLDTLKKRGVIASHRNRYTLRQSQEEIISGVMRMHPRGFGFVEVKSSPLYPEDIFIPKQLTGTAVEGDLVEVVINPSSFSEKGPEGRVIAILSRARTHIGAIIQEIGSKGWALAYAPTLGKEQKVVVQNPIGEELNVGDRVVLKVTEWGGKSQNPEAELSHVIGSIEDASKDILAAIEDFDLRGEFPREVIEQAKTFGTRVKPQDIKERLDLRSLEIFTIDPDTAKDFDDALNIAKDSNGHYHLGVHIADVSYYVTSGSPLDEEAKMRSNSTYFPGNCLPMLPKELSENLCSLKPRVQRLTVSVLMTFDELGELKNYSICRSVIKSVARFTYKQAKKILDGQKSEHAPSLRLMQELCDLLKAKRKERGSIDFGLPELVLHVDKDGNPTHTERIEYDVTHQLVEEFMLKANEVVATHLDNQGKGLTFRVHEVPLEESMRDFSNLANAFGFKLSEEPAPKELQDLFEEALESPYGEYLATSYIRRMRLATYSPNNIGHFGLGLTHYCHFTSPIRRYADLIVHRVLFGEEPDIEALKNISSHCSSQERVSAKAEQSVHLMKKLRFLQQKKRECPKKQYPAVVTKVKPFGAYFEIVELMMEGFLHVSELPDDYYVFDEEKHILRGTRRRKMIAAGDKLTVMLRNVDLVFQLADWTFVG